MPGRLPRNFTAQADYNRQLHRRFAATRRVPAPTPSSAPPLHDPVDDLRRLGELHESGVLTDQEFAAGKARILDAGTPA
jgi:hypothetical protein